MSNSQPIGPLWGPTDVRSPLVVFHPSGYCFEDGWTATYLEWIFLLHPGIPIMKTPLFSRTNYLLLGLLLWLPFSLLLPHHAHGQHKNEYRRVPEGLGNNQWAAIQDSWWMYARPVTITSKEGDQRQGLLLTADSAGVWVLEDAYWPLVPDHADRITLIPADSLVQIEIGKRTRPGRAAILGGLRTTIWSSAFFAGLASTDYQFALFITSAFFTPIGLVINSVFHAIASGISPTIWVLNPQHYQSVIKPRLQKWSVVDDIEAYSKLPMQDLYQQPQTWQTMGESITGIERLLRRPKLTLDFGFMIPFGNGATMAALNRYWGSLNGGSLTGLNSYYLGGKYGLTYELKDNIRISASTIQHVEYWGSVYNLQFNNSQDYFSYDFFHNTAEWRVGLDYGIIPYDGTRPSRPEVYATAELGITQLNNSMNLYSDVLPYPQALYYPTVNLPTLAVGLSTSLYAHRWLRLGLDVGYRLAPSVQYPAIDLYNVDGVVYSLDPTAVPNRQFQFVFSAQVPFYILNQ